MKETGRDTKREEVTGKERKGYKERDRVSEKK